jgi:hypothetical protein
VGKIGRRLSGGLVFNSCGINRFEYTRLPAKTIAPDARSVPSAVRTAVSVRQKWPFSSVTATRSRGPTARSGSPKG